MLKENAQPAGALLATAVNNSKVVSSIDRNNIKSAQSDFTKPVCEAEESSFIAPNARQVFTQLR